jgi:hypothetical protein
MVGLGDDMSSNPTGSLTGLQALLNLHMYATAGNTASHDSAAATLPQMHWALVGLAVYQV